MSQNCMCALTNNSFVVFFMIDIFIILYLCVYVYVFAYMCVQVCILVYMWQPQEGTGSLSLSLSAYSFVAQSLPEHGAYISSRLTSQLG